MICIRKKEGADYHATLKGNTSSGKTRDINDGNSSGLLCCMKSSTKS